MPAVQKPHCKRVMPPERFLQHRKPAGRRRQRFDGANVGAVGLHGQRKTRARGNAVDLDRAGAADAMLAADMGAGQRQVMAQDIAEQGAWFGFRLHHASIDGEADAVARIGAQARHRRASSIVTRPILRTSSRR